ncbi:MAG: FlgO family outer membrane protein [Blastocatellia bacterium]
MTIANGARFDRYEILSHLGSGGMGEVYLARDSRLERKIAIKLLPAEFTRDPARLHRFVTEAKAASALNHPNIITIHEIGESEGRHFITTEYVEGRTLRQAIAAGRLSALAAIDIASQIASALAAAHQAGIVHRDIKPENVMIRPDGIVKVLDFGLAKLTERYVPETNSEARTAAMLDTDPGMVLGTATYMSPEQARGLRVDGRTDIFSLGVVLYEMVAGRTPFEGHTAADLIGQVLNHEPRPLSSHTGGVPIELQRIVSKTLRKDREERYQTIKDLLLDLKSLKRELEATGMPAYTSTSSSGGSARLAVTYETSALPGPSSSNATLIEPAHRSSAEYLVHQVKTHRRAFLAAIAGLAAVGTGFVLFNGNNEIDSIAVLPFTIAKDEPEAQQLSDAITNSVINDLSKLPHLKVKSRLAVQPYVANVNGSRDIRKIGEDLDVQAVVIGDIVKRGDALTINVALVDARESNNLWGERYSRKIADLLLVQQEISRDVSDKLRLKLSGEEKKRLDAHQLYVKGRNAWSKRTAEGLQEGISLFEQAVKMDPSYAPAYAGLADCYNMLVNYAIQPGTDVFPKAKEAAEKALALDDRLAEAHAALGYTYFQWQWNWEEAEREFLRAIELKSDYGPAHQWYSSLLAATGKTDQAFVAARRAQELEPFSLIVSSHLGWINYLARRYDQTLAETRQILKLAPGFFAAHRYQALALESLGRYDEAIKKFQDAIPLSRGSVLLKAELAHAYAVAGKRTEARQALGELQQLSTQRHISPFYFALIHTGLGEKDRAIELLNNALDERAERMVWLRVDPRFDKLRGDARFNDLIQFIGLAQ